MDIQMQTSLAPSWSPPNQAAAILPLGSSTTVEAWTDLKGPCSKIYSVVALRTLNGPPTGIRCSFFCCAEVVAATKQQASITTARYMFVLLFLSDIFYYF